MKSREEQLLAEIEALRQNIVHLEEENRDLEITLRTVTEHGDLFEAELQNVNRRLQAEIIERKRAEATLYTLVEVISQQKSDLEIILDTLREHGDLVDAQWYEKVCRAQRLALFDALTQIPNRRHFDDHLQHQWRQMSRERSPLSIILCDVDHFKQFNDVYGHLAGDECLKQVAQVLYRIPQRPNDLVARYGGEEFAIILPQTCLQGALHIAAQMQAKIRKVAIPHVQSSVSEFVTLSMGVVCTIPDAQRSPTILLDEADQLLYLAKRKGRNQIVHIPCITVEAEGVSKLCKSAATTITSSTIPNSQRSPSEGPSICSECRNISL